MHIEPDPIDVRQTFVAALFRAERFPLTKHLMYEPGCYDVTLSNTTFDRARALISSTFPRRCYCPFIITLDTGRITNEVNSMTTMVGRRQKIRSRSRARMIAP